MCVVSMIYDHGRQNPPWGEWPTIPFRPMPDDKERDEQTRQAILDWLKLLDAAKKYDKSSGQPDCEDPKKATFEEEVLRRLYEIEKRIAKGTGDV